MSSTPTAWRSSSTPRSYPSNRGTHRAEGPAFTLAHLSLSLPASLSLPVSLSLSLTAAQWDLRTFHLLHTVPALDQCRLVFNSNATIMYGGRWLHIGRVHIFLCPTVNSSSPFVQRCCRPMTRTMAWTGGRRASLAPPSGPLMLATTSPSVGATSCLFPRWLRDLLV